MSLEFVSANCGRKICHFCHYFFSQSHIMSQPRGPTLRVRFESSQSWYPLSLIYWNFQPQYCHLDWGHPIIHWVYHVRKSWQSECRSSWSVWVLLKISSNASLIKSLFVLHIRKRIEPLFLSILFCNPDQQHRLHFFLPSFFISTVVWLFNHCWLRIFGFLRVFQSSFLLHHAPRFL